MNKLSKQIQEENVEKKEFNCSCGCSGTKDQNKNTDYLVSFKITQYDKKGEDCC
jgi:hypothetical protein